MNATRRKQLQQVKQDLRNIIEDEQSAYDNLPESFQNGERGENMQSAIDSMESAMSELDEVC